MKLEVHYKPMTEKQYEQFIEYLADFIEFCLKRQKEVTNQALLILSTYNYTNLIERFLRDIEQLTRYWAGFKDEKVQIGLFIF